MYLDTHILLEWRPVVAACQLRSWCGNTQIYIATLPAFFFFEMVHAYDFGNNAVV